MYAGILVPSKFILSVSSLSNFSLRGSGLNIDRNAAPSLLVKPQEAKQEACEVADKNGEPNMYRLQCARFLYDKANADRKQHLRDYRNEQWASRITRSLQAAGIGECHRNKQA